jgi:hypothetical protein
MPRTEDSGNIGCSQLGKTFEYCRVWKVREEGKLKPYRIHLDGGYKAENLNLKKSRLK